MIGKILEQKENQEEYWKDRKDTRGQQGYQKVARILEGSKDTRSQQGYSKYKKDTRRQ